MSADDLDTHVLLRAFADELVRSGVRHACTSPGSRSTPLVLALVRDGRLAVHSHVDERAAAFFALGIAKATGQPLFAGTPPQAAASWREDILDNDPVALAAVLRGVGTGTMEPLWDRLGELTMPATVLAGERDAKFMALGERLAGALPRGELVIVEGAGHGIPREDPAAVAAAIG